MDSFIFSHEFCQGGCELPTSVPRRNKILPSQAPKRDSRYNLNIMKSRKELKESYKQMKIPMGVFLIRNTANKKIFIGSSMNLNAVWNSQKFQLDMGTHRNPALQSDWIKFGASNFSYEILSEVKRTEKTDAEYRREVKALEALFLEELKPFDESGYNRA